MKYFFTYKSSDGMRHEDQVEASSRDEVFSLLRARGIKPIKVVAADGSKANGEVIVRGVRKRVVTLVVVALLLCALLAVLLAFRAGEHSNIQTFQNSNNSFLTDTTRRQVIGDAAIIEKGIRTGWADVFSSEGDRFLASFAIPGVKAGVGTTSIAALEAVLTVTNRFAVGGIPPGEGKTIRRNLAVAPATRGKKPLGIEAQQIIAIVKGMKNEALAYLAAGGTLVEYGTRLTERQDAEIAIYKRVEAEILAAQKTLSESAFLRLYEQRNDALRNLGLKPIVLSDD